MEKVRCVDCGLYTYRHHEKGWVEIGADTRRTLSLLVIESNTTISPHDPVCFVRAADLMSECGGNRSNWTGPRFAKAIVGERICDSFVRWCQGFTPKEHAEMSLAKAIRQEAEAARLQAQAWQEEQRREREKWEAAEKEKDRAEKRRTQIVTWSLSLITAVVTLAIKLAYDYVTR